MPGEDDNQEEYLSLLNAHRGAVYGYILSIHPDRMAAQDILQETFIVLWKKRGDFLLGTNFKAWAFRFAHFQVLAHLRRVKHKSWLVFEEGLVDIIAQEAEDTSDEFEQRRIALKRCLKRLREEDLWLIRAFYEWRLPLAEIGTKINRTPAALKQAMFRIRLTLRTCIERSPWLGDESGTLDPGTLS